MHTHVSTTPSSCPPSIASLAFSASARFSYSTYAKPRDRPTLRSMASSTSCSAEEGHCF